jgi:hypothetical protein
MCQPLVPFGVQEKHPGHYTAAGDGSDANVMVFVSPETSAAQLRY